MSSKLLAIGRLPAYRITAPDYLGQRAFFITIGAAFLLHVGAFYLWQLMPRTTVVDVPVRVLNIKLGDGEATQEDSKPAAAAENKNRSPSRFVREQVKPTAPPPKATNKEAVTKAFDKAIATPESKERIVGKFDMRTEKPSTSAPVMPVVSHLVRPPGEALAPAAGAGSALGTSTSSTAEMKTHYEQQISMWINKFQIYPEEARKAGMTGDALVRMRIDRQGNIGFYILENSTGYQVLDRAALDMVRRANPVPAVPNDYPQNDLMEFLVPIAFHEKK